MINQLRQSQKRERWLLYLYVQSLAVDNRAEEEEEEEEEEDVNSDLHRHHDWEGMCRIAQ